MQTMFPVILQLAKLTQVFTGDSHRYFESSPSRHVVIDIECVINCYCLKRLEFGDCDSFVT